MAQKSKITGSIVSPDGIITLEKGKVYPDSIITEGVDQDLFDTVDDSALEEYEAVETESEEEGDEKPKKKTRKTKSELE